MRARSRHFAAIALERREKLIVETCWLRSFDLATNISSHSEVRILINSTRNQAWDIVLSKNVGETARKARSCLNSRVGSFSTVICKLKAKDGFKRGQVDVSLENANVGVHGTHILGVKDDKSFFRVKSQS